MHDGNQFVFDDGSCRSDAQELTMAAAWFTPVRSVGWYNIVLAGLGKAGLLSRHSNAWLATTGARQARDEHEFLRQHIR